MQTICGIGVCRIAYWKLHVRRTHISTAIVAQAGPLAMPNPLGFGPIRKCCITHLGLKRCTSAPEIKNHVDRVARQCCARLSEVELEAVIRDDPVFPDWLPEFAKNAWNGEGGEKKLNSEQRKTAFLEYLKLNREQYQVSGPNAVGWEVIRKIVWEDFQAEPEEVVVKFLHIAEARAAVASAEKAEEDEMEEDAVEEALPPVAARCPCSLNKGRLAKIGASFLEKAKEFSAPSTKNGVTPAQAQVQNLILTVSRDVGDAKAQRKLDTAANLTRSQKKQKRALGDEFVAVARQPAIPTARISDEALRKMLLPHSTISCKWSARIGEQASRLDGSLLSIWENHKKLRETYDYRTVAEKLQGGRLGLLKGEVYGDGCPICMTFDDCVVGSIARAVVFIERELTKLHPAFYEAMPQAGPEYEFEAGKRYYDNHNWLRTWLEYTLQKFADLEGQVDMVAYTELKFSLDDVEKAFQEGDDEHEGYISLVSKFNVHFELKSMVWQILLGMLHKPTAGTGYCWIDFRKVRHFLEQAGLDSKMCFHNSPSRAIFARHRFKQHISNIVCAIWFCVLLCCLARPDFFGAGPPGHKGFSL